MRSKDGGSFPAATPVDVPTGWDPRTKQQSTGLLFATYRWPCCSIPVRVIAAATAVDIPSRWDPNTKKEPTGLFFAACGRPCSFDSSYGLHEKIPDPKIRDFIHDPYGNRTHVTAVKGRCLHRLTNGPGSGNLTRTDDTPGMNRMLYQLSYAAIYCCVSQQEILYRQRCDLSTTFVWIFHDFRKFFLSRQPIRPKRRPGRGPRRAHGGADYADLRPRRRP